jgi:hypothetical protein
MKPQVPLSDDQAIMFEKSNIKIALHFSFYAFCFAIGVVAATCLALDLASLLRPGRPSRMVVWIAGAVFFGGGGLLFLSQLLAYIRLKHPLFVATKEGLIVPFLGSQEPIPWADVRMRRGALLSWFLITLLYCRINPLVHKDYPGLHNRAFAWRSRPEKKKIMVAMPNIISGGSDRLIFLISEMNKSAALKA